MPKILFIISRYGTLLDMSIFVGGEPDFVHRWNVEDADRDSADL